MDSLSWMPTKVTSLSIVMTFRRLGLVNKGYDPINKAKELSGFPLKLCPILENIRRVGKLLISLLLMMDLVCPHCTLDDLNPLLYTYNFKIRISIKNARKVKLILGS